MEREEVLKKAGAKKALVGEMEKAKIGKSNWIANICAVVVAVAFMITFGALGNFTALYAIALVCFTWATVFYFCQYFIAKRPWPLLLGAILELLGGLTMLTLFILFSIGVL